MPPAVAQLNYISSGLLWLIFSQTGIFAGFSLQIINLAVRISATAMAGDIIFFSLAGPLWYYTGAHTVIFCGIFSLCYSPEGRAKLRWAEKSFDVGGPSSIDFIYFWGSNKKQQCDGRGGGAQRPVSGSIKLKKTGARSARARTCGQNPLVTYIGAQKPSCANDHVDQIQRANYEPDLNSWIFSCSGRVSFYAPNIRCANKLASYK